MKWITFQLKITFEVINSIGQVLIFLAYDSSSVVQVLNSAFNLSRLIGFKIEVAASVGR
jgi:hypothetical protein